jgi:hypothetical protein
VSIAKTRTEPVYFPLVAHIDEALEVLQTEQDNRPEAFDQDELKLLEILQYDLRTHPIMGLPIFRRRGTRTFIISIDQKIEMSLRATLKGEMTRSRLVLSSDQPYCRQKILQRIVQAACIEARVVLVKEVRFCEVTQHNIQLFVFTVDFG